MPLAFANGVVAWGYLLQTGVGSSPVAPWPGDECRILSISGGGFLGLYAAKILANFEERAGIPIGRCFDLLAGTSIGGIIALAIAAEVPMKDVVAAFERDGHEIFPNNGAPQNIVASAIDLCRFLLTAKYRQPNLRCVVEAILGSETQMSDVKHRVIIPAVNMTKGEPQIFKSPHLPRYERDWRLNIVDIALATSAAPTIFPIAQLNSQLYVDGGLYANAPDLLALHEATYFMEAPAAKTYMLSVGTTTSKYSLAHATGTNFGAAQWMMNSRLLSASLSSQQQIVRNIMGHLLEGRYVRIDRERAPEQERYLSLDVATSNAVAEIAGLAEASTQDFIGKPEVVAFLNYRAQTPIFYHGGNN